jgi:hypothetical protein
MSDLSPRPRPWQGKVCECGAAVHTHAYGPDHWYEDIDEETDTCKVHSC